ncbi:hypothetical protein PG996_006274 [Apiospora saccharicola]|uniref:Uncharacterized protein n=1 Tax=Apiospora saccharicola TaxID=335842 RepID=A0ABR1VNU7_9PEZI
MEIDRDSCLFYSCVGTEYDVTRERDARDYLGSYSILEERWQDHDWVFERLQNVAGGSTPFWETASAALAQECSGLVYVLLPSGTSGRDFPQGSIWVSHEWPNLQDATHVSKVIRLKLDDASYQESIFDSSVPGHKKRGIAYIG